MATTSIIYDIILTGIIAAFYLALYGAAVAAVKYRSKPTKGNPFRQFNDWQIRNIIKRQK